jgi:hypothetical protein
MPGYDPLHAEGVHTCRDKGCGAAPHPIGVRYLPEHDADLYRLVSGQFVSIEVRVLDTAEGRMYKRSVPG